MTDPTGATALATRPLDRIAALIPPAPPDVRPGRAEIAAVVDAIAGAFRPAQIVLFGSRAYGVPTSESDVDLMVVMDDPPDREHIRQAIPPELERTSRVQIHVRRPERIALGLAEGDFFIEDVMLKGIVLYEGSGMDGRNPDPGEIAGPANTQEGDDAVGLTAATREWLRKADDDARAVDALLELPRPLLDAACFHAQQCAEKSLKGLLQEHGIRFPRTHDLVALAALATPVVPPLADHTAALTSLTDCAVRSRYLELDVTPEQAEAAVETMTTVRNLVRTALGLDA